MSRTVLVTGTSSGIGAATALRLAARGWQVLAGVRRAKDGERLARLARRPLRWVELDVTDAAQIAAVAQEVERATGEPGLDALVNNAGIVVPGPLEAVPLDDLRRQLEVNVVGHVAVVQALLPSLRRARGRLVLMGSIGGRVGQPFIAAYTASKHALEAIADALRVELAPAGIRVSLIEPGSVRTAVWSKSAAYFDGTFADASPELRALYGDAVERVRFAARLQERGAIPPEWVARVVVRVLESRSPRPRYLVGPEARALAVFRRLPDRVRDAVIRRSLALPRG